MLIYLLRHGQTEYNAQKRYQGQRDIPLSPEGARAMIGRLKAAKLLTGFRGRSASDVEALSDVLVRVAAMCCALGDRLVSLDLNPVMVLPDGDGVRIVDIVMQVAPARHCGETD